MWNGSSSYGATVGNAAGDPLEGRWCWLFGTWPIQDRD